MQSEVARNHPFAEKPRKPMILNTKDITNRQIKEIEKKHCHQLLLQLIFPPASNSKRG
jgi:hypothetical protein